MEQLTFDDMCVAFYVDSDGKLNLEQSGPYIIQWR